MRTDLIGCEQTGTLVNCMKMSKAAGMPTIAGSTPIKMNDTTVRELPEGDTKRDLNTSV